MEKPKVCVKGRSLVPQKTVPLKCLTGPFTSSAFTFVTLWHHYVPLLIYYNNNPSFKVEFLMYLNDEIQISVYRCMFSSPKMFQSPPEKRFPHVLYVSDNDAATYEAPALCFGNFVLPSLCLLWSLSDHCCCRSLSVSLMESQRNLLKCFLQTTTESSTSKLKLGNTLTLLSAQPLCGG